MRSDPRISILRDPREDPRKCSLRGLHGRPDVAFHRWRADRTWDAIGRVLLAVGAPVLAPEDAAAGLLLLDCSWRRVPSLRRCLLGDPVERSLPPLRTAYPRTARAGTDPDAGLASIEALYAAVALLWGPDLTLLDGYPSAAAFLAQNPHLGT